ncbi:MAG: site-specific integrase [Pirellulales bacterium]|nr:site-specific integrase [Pirellulales bacterium]
MASVFKRGGKNNRGGYWYVSWFDHSGRRRSKCAKTTDKATAEQIARKLETEAAKRREGLIDPRQEAFAREAKRPIAELVAEYKAKLVANGRTERYIAEAIGYVERIAKAEGIGTATELTAERVAHYAAQLSDQGKSARTMQAVIGAAKSFTKWLVKCGKLPRDPLAGVSKPSPASDRKYRRRMLLPDEWPLLRAATVAGPQRYGLTGAERALLYQSAIQTGLRASELRSLTRRSVVFNATQPYIRLEAAHAKNGKAASQQIDQALAELLRAHVANKLPTAALFALPHITNLARMIRDDLEAARKAWIDEANDDVEEVNRRQQSDFLAVAHHDGRVLDFHSLRHTCGAWLALSGMHVKTVQSVMRHSTITLTMDAYGHLLPGAEAEAADRLGEMISLTARIDDAEENIVRMTGTDGQSAQRLAQQLGREMGPKPASPCEGNWARLVVADGDQALIDSEKPSRIAPLEHAVRLGTMVSPLAAPLAQLAEQLTLNQ